MSPSSSRLIVAGACAIAIVAIVAQAQYSSSSSNFDSDSNSNSELGKLVRNSGRIQAQNQRLNQQAAAAVAAATRNLHNHHQPMQYSPSHHRGSSNYGSSSGAMRGDEHQAYGPLAGLTGAHNMGAQGRSGSAAANSDIDDDEASSYGPSAFDGPHNFNGQSGANQNDDGEGSQLDGPSSSLDKAASGGYPSSQGDYSGSNEGAGFNFDGANFGPSSADGADFGPSEANFGGHHEGKRAKSASSPMSSRNFGSSDESDAGAPQYGPNSAINADGEEVVDGRAGYAPQGDNDNDNDDE